jgi:hypothetical protein
MELIKLSAADAVIYVMVIVLSPYEPVSGERFIGSLGIIL